MQTERHAQRVPEECPDVGLISFGSVVVGAEKGSRNERALIDIGPSGAV